MNESNTEVNELLKLELEMAKIKYDYEIKREESVIQQSGRMQASFSFILASVFVVATILSQNTDIFPAKMSISAIGSITIIFIISFTLSTMAQTRKKQHIWADIKEQRGYIDVNQKPLMTEEAKNKFILNNYEKVQLSLTNNTRDRIRLISWSMRAFYFGLLTCLAWFFVFVLYMN